MNGTICFSLSTAPWPAGMSDHLGLLAGGGADASAVHRRSLLQSEDDINALFSAPAGPPIGLSAVSPGSVLDSAASQQLTEDDIDPPAFAPVPGTAEDADSILAKRAAAASSAAALAAASAYNNLGADVSFYLQ